MAGRIPQHFIDDLLNRADIIDVVGARVQLKKAGREFTACCPFHHEKTPSFTVSPNKQFYHCFGCGAHGNAIGFLMEHDNLPFVEAVEELARLAGVEVPREQGHFDTDERDKHQPLYNIQTRAAKFFQDQLRTHPAAPKAVEYLKNRGLTGEIARDFGLGYAPPGWDNLLSLLGTDDAQRNSLFEAGLTIQKDEGGYYDRFRDRIMFPIHDKRGRVIAFGGRVLGDEKPKYLNSPETPIFHKGRELYGLYQARQHERKLERLLVVEGYMDVVALAQFGIRNAVATLGTATTREHLEQIFRIVPEVIFCFDGDEAGGRAAWRALENALPVMKEGREARFLFLPQGDDPDSLVRREGADSFRQRTQEATPFSQFFFDHFAAQFDLHSAEGQGRLASAAKPLLQQLPEGLYRDMMLSRLSEQTGLPAQRIARFVGDSTQQPATPAKTPTRPRREPTSDRRPIRRLIALLLAEPALARQLENLESLRENEERGIDILLELLEVLRDNPHLNTAAAILERFRGHYAESHLWQLAQQPLDIPETGRADEFQGLLRLLLRQQRERRLEFLQDKLATQGQLESHELNEWQTLLRER